MMTPEGSGKAAGRVPVQRQHFTIDVDLRKYLCS